DRPDETLEQRLLQRPRLRVLVVDSAEQAVQVIAVVARVEYGGLREERGGAAELPAQVVHERGRDRQRETVAIPPPLELVHAELRHDGDARRDELERLAVETADACAARQPEELREARMPMGADAKRVQTRPLDQRLAVQQRRRRPLRGVAVERDGRHAAVTGINFHARFRISAILRKVPFFVRFVPTKSGPISGKSYSA